MLTNKSEWRMRLDAWRKKLKEFYYRPLGQIEFEGFTTLEQLSLEQAQARFAAQARPMPSGSQWGAKWEYGWFKTDFIMPPEASGQWLTVNLNVGGDGLVFLDGEVLCARDRRHTHTLITNRAKAGRKHQLVLEAYAGHGAAPCHLGPICHGAEPIPETPDAQRTVETSTLGIWEEDAFQLSMDVETLYHLRQNIEPNSLRAAEIEAGLRQFTVTVDFELQHEEMLKSFRDARKALKPLLDCVNGSTTPTMYCFGHAHLDVAWLWPLQETVRKAARTFSNQLQLASLYRDYKFLQSESHLYWMLQQNYPDLYKRVRKAVKSGSVIADGGMYVEADTNIAGGEALIRQFLYGKQFFQEEFGVDNQMLWLPDVFGYSGALPQILAGCGIKYFSTAKIFWNYHAGQPFPYNTFVWEGIDGTGILTHLCNDYNSGTDPETVIKRWNNRVQKDGVSTRLFPFGHGDGGGGPTREHLEYVRRLSNLEGVPRMQMATPQEYFEDAQAKGVGGLKYVGELYFQGHRGTYTSQARTKRGNRKSECAMREAECWSAIAGALNGFAFPAERMKETWRMLLVNQFHDILPGSSIERVYQEAEADFAQVIADADKLASQAALSLVRPAEAMTVFNSLNWPRTALVELPRHGAAANADGNALPVQNCEGRLVAQVDLPALGWTTVRIGDGTVAPPVVPAGKVKATARLLENDLLRVAFNRNGEITSIFDKKTGRELAGGPCNSMRMYKDLPTAYDAWDLDSNYVFMPVELADPAQFEAVATGPLLGRIRVTRKINNSTMTQDITLRRGSRRIDFTTRIDWQERHKLLKVAFNTTVHSSEAIHEIQFGHLRRPTHSSAQFDADRFEVSNHKWTALAEEGRGVAILNDCKYGLNVVDGTINLTLLKSPVAPDAHADLGNQEFTYAFYAWDGPLCGSDIIRQAYDLNVPALVVPGDGGQNTVFRLDADNIVIETAKPAEDGSGDIILRLYEAMRTATRCCLTTTLPIGMVRQTDMLENTLEGVEAIVEVNDGRMELDFRPFEIKTLRLKRRR